MKKMHERHMKLMKEVDENYKLIEEETQDHFTEFLDKWKKLAKNKIDQYKAAFGNLKNEKEDIQTQLHTVVTDLQDKNKKIVDDYEKLLEKYHNDIEGEKKQHKEKAELMQSRYGDEMSKLKQEKIELESLLEAIKSQKDTLEQKTQEIRKTMKENILEGQQNRGAIVGNYLSDCAALVVERIVSAVEVNCNAAEAESRAKEQKREIENLRNNVTRLEKEKENLKQEVRKMPSIAPGKKPMKPAGEDVTSGPVVITGDTKKYDELIVAKSRLIRKIHTWKADFEKREGRKCEKADCEPIHDLYHELKVTNEQIMEFKGVKDSEAAPGINDSFASIGSDDVNRSRSMSPRSKGRQTPSGDKGEKGFSAAVGASLAEIEELKQENRNLKDELQKLRLSMTSAVTETAAIKQLKNEIESMKKDKDQWRVKYQELATKAAKDALQPKAPTKPSVVDPEATKKLKDEVDSLKKLNEQLRKELATKEIMQKKEAVKAAKTIDKTKEIAAVKDLSAAKEELKEAFSEIDRLKEENAILVEKAAEKPQDKPQDKPQSKPRTIAVVSEVSYKAPKIENTYKIEFEKMVNENQELIKKIEALEIFQGKALDLDAKLQEREKELALLKEKYEKVGLERVSLGKQLLQLKEIEAERAKARSDALNEPATTEQEQAFRDLAKDYEIVKAQIAKQDEEAKATMEKLDKLTKDNEELADRVSTLQKFEGDRKELEAVQQKLADAERELSQVRMQMAMGLPEAPKERNALIKADYEKLIADNQTIKDKYEAVQKRLASLKDLKKNYDDKVTEVAQLRQELRRMQIENEEVTKKADTVSDCKSKIADLRMQLADKAPRETSNIRQEMRKIVEENKELQAKANISDELKKNYLECKATADSNLIELTKLKQEYKKMELEREALRSKADKATSYMMERNSLRVQLAKLSKADDNGGGSGSGETGAMKAEISRLFSENEQLLKTIEATEKMRKESTQKDERIKELEAKLKIGKDRVKELEQQVNKVGESKNRENIEKIKPDAREFEKQLEKERLANKTLKLEIEKNTKKQDQLREKEVRDLDEKLRRMEAQHKQDVTSLEKASIEEIDKRAKELASAKTDITKLTETNTSLQAAKSELESKSKILSQNVQRLESDLAKIGAEASRAVVLQEKVEKMTAQIEKERTDYVVMEKKYKDEMLQRRRLHNIIEDMKGKIRVYCRVRPMSPKEIEMGSASIATIVDEFTVKLDTKYGPKAFSFDASFGSGASQESIFEDTKRLVQSSVDGFNVCIFAYGQTGAGKTFTIQGSESDPGIAPRSFDELEKIMKAMNNYTCSLECYMVELYLDTLSDLLLQKELRKSPPHLDIKEDMKGMVFVQGVTKHVIKTAEDARKIFDLGLNNRKTFATQMNDNSSRSHLVFSILIETVNKQTSQRAVGKISFVDLAGSERATKAGNSTERLKEGRAINKSLSALGDVISTLSSGCIISYLILIY